MQERRHISRKQFDHFFSHVSSSAPGNVSTCTIETMHAGLVPVLYMKMMSEFEAAKKELIKACKDPATTFIFSR